MNTITELLNLEDSDVYISDIKIEGTQKIITLETHPSIHFCPQCDFRMHSRGVKQRKINHPILQDTYECVLLLKQRRWKCTNPLCNYSFNESFNFVGKRKRNTNATEMLIVNEFKDLSMSAARIAEKFNVSDLCSWILDMPFIINFRLSISILIIKSTQILFSSINTIRCHAVFTRLRQCYLILNSRHIFRFLR